MKATHWAPNAPLLLGGEDGMVNAALSRGQFDEPR